MSGYYTETSVTICSSPCYQVRTQNGGLPGCAPLPKKIQPTKVAIAPSGPEPPQYRDFTITLRHTSLGRSPLDERSARRRDLSHATHNTNRRETSMSLAGFETTIPASERPQTNNALDCAITEIGHGRTCGCIYMYIDAFPVDVMWHLCV
jgi:hypothetical protein